MPADAVPTPLNDTWGELSRDAFDERRHEILHLSQEGLPAWVLKPAGEIFLRRRLHLPQPQRGAALLVQEPELRLLRRCGE